MKIRIKTHSFPGDIPRAEKIKRQESSRWKSYKKLLKLRARAVSKRIAKKVIEEQEDDGDVS